MKRSTVTIAILALLLAIPFDVPAGEPERIALAVRLFDAMDIKRRFDDSFAMMRHMQASTINQILKQEGLSDNDAVQAAAAQERMSAMLEKELSWDSIKDEYAAIYASTFTEKELRDLIAFYKSPAGRAMTLKSPDLIAKGMELVQQRVAAIGPKIRQIADECNAKPSATQAPESN